MVDGLKIYAYDVVQSTPPDMVGLGMIQFHDNEISLDIYAQCDC